MDLLLAQQQRAGGFAVSITLLVLVLAWPLMRRVFRGLGTMFALYGAVLFVAAGASGSSAGLGHAAGLLFGGLALRAVGGLRYHRRNRRPRGPAAAISRRVVRAG